MIVYFELVTGFKKQAGEPLPPELKTEMEKRAGLQEEDLQDLLVLSDTISLKVKGNFLIVNIKNYHKLHSVFLYILSIFFCHIWPKKRNCILSSKETICIMTFPLWNSDSEILQMSA